MTAQNRSGPRTYHPHLGEGGVIANEPLPGVTCAFHVSTIVTFTPPCFASLTPKVLQKLDQRRRRSHQNPVPHQIWHGGGGVVALTRVWFKMAFLYYFTHFKLHLGHFLLWFTVSMMAHLLVLLLFAPQMFSADMNAFLLWPCCSLSSDVEMFWKMSVKFYEPTLVQFRSTLNSLGLHPRLLWRGQTSEKLWGGKRINRNPSEFLNGDSWTGF